MSDSEIRGPVFPHFAALNAGYGSVDLLGADNVVAGSDWPVASDRPIRGMLTDAMRHAKLSEDEQKAIAAGNCLRLLGLG